MIQLAEIDNIVNFNGFSNQKTPCLDFRIEKEKDLGDIRVTLGRPIL